MRSFVAILLSLFCLPLSAQSIALISDLNGRYGSISYHARVSGAVDTIAGLNPLLVISTGDMVAGQASHLNSEALSTMWQSFSQTVADPLMKAGIPLLVSVGNHDGSAYPEFALDREHFAEYWRTRTNGVNILPGSDWPRRYAARQGPFLLVAFDGTRSGPLPAGERRFVGRMLERHGSEAIATVVFSHLPLWPVARGREHEIIDDPELLGLMHRHGVDVYASGHHHAYYAGVDEAGMVHVSVGALGGNVRAHSGRAGKSSHSFAILVLEDGGIRIAARAAPGFGTEISAEDLPATLHGPLGTLRRMDRPVALRP